MNHMILIGFMGCGKSSVGKRLANMERLAFVDTDAMIEEQTGKKINDIFAESGEAYFRELETQAVRQLQKEHERKVIAVGGGLPVRPVNRRYLKELGCVVYLTAEVETLVQRLQGDTARPMLQGGELRKRIERLMDERGALYEEAADVKIATDGKSFEEIIKEIRTYVE